MKQSTPTPDQGALERARELYETTAHLYRTDRAWMRNVTTALTAAEAKARAAERKAIIQELSACPENLRVRLKQHPSYSCECALTIATWLATTRRRRDDNG